MPGLNHVHQVSRSNAITIIPEVVLVELQLPKIEFCFMSISVDPGMLHSSVGGIAQGCVDVEYGIYTRTMKFQNCRD